MKDQERLIPFARALGAHGVKGEVNVTAFDERLTQFFSSGQWFLRPYPAKEGVLFNTLVPLSVRGKSLKRFVLFPGVQDRDEAQKIRGTLYAKRGSLPAPTPVFYFSDDLLNLKVCSRNGMALGFVINVANNGAQDMLEVQPQRGHAFFIPMVPLYVLSVDFENDVITCDWEMSWV